MAICRRCLAALLVMLATGCAASTTAISKRNLDVQTKMTDAIFLAPVVAHDRTIYVEVRNTSDKPDFDLDAAVVAQIRARGYQVVSDPDDARFLLQANVLQAGRTSPTAAERTFAGGFGSTILGGAAGAGAGRAASEETGAIIAGALVGAAVSAAADAYVQDVTYTIVTDIQISERTAEGVMVTERMSQRLDQGSSGQRILTSTEVHDWKRYRTRVMSTANRVNLDFDDAAPALVDGLTRAIAGIF